MDSAKFVKQLNNFHLPISINMNKISAKIPIQ